MRALDRLGRAGEALQAFRDYRDLLAEELGLDPSQQLFDLQAAILRRDLEPPRAPPVIESQPRPVGNLRLELTELVGRKGDVATALAALDGARVVTLTGVGGVGKTRLALRVAADAQPRHPDGTWICELAGVRDGAVVPDVIAAALGVQQRQGSTVTDRLVLPVQPLPVLAPSMPRDVPAVAAVPSVALFRQRAESASGLTGDAATRVQSLSPQEIAYRLERWLQFLRSARRIQEERRPLRSRCLGRSSC